MAAVSNSARAKQNPAWLWIVFAVVLGAVAVGVLWWWKATNSQPAATCQPQNLGLSLGKTERVNDLSYIHAVVTNNGKQACSLEGYPIVSALDGKGENRVVSQAQKNPYFEPRLVTLASRGQAYTAIGVPDAGSFNPGVCTEPTATLRLFLPGETALRATPLTTEFAYKICPGFSVTAFMPGN